MKNVFACLAFAAFVSGGIVAQAAPSDGGTSIAERATAMTWRIAERTQLSEGQYIRLRRLNVALLTETAELRKEFKADPASLDHALADVQMRYEWDVAAVLQPKQLAVYDGLKAEVTAANIR